MEANIENQLIKIFLDDHVVKDWLFSINSTAWQDSLHSFHQIIQKFPHDKVYQELFSHFLISTANSANPDKVIVNFSRLLDSNPHVEKFLEEMTQQPRMLEILSILFDGSQFLSEILLRNPEVYCSLLPENWEFKPKNFESLTDETIFIAKKSIPIPDRLDELRQYQQIELLRIGLCDLLNFFDIITVTEQLSCLADSVIQACHLLAFNESTVDTNDLIIVAMGKLGGKELNYSSDIDLVFWVEETSDQLRHNTELLLDYLARVTGAGFLYRVDIRLRPWGNSGPLVSSFNSYKLYFKKHARTWEKQALLKARIVSGDRAKGEEFMLGLLPLILEIEPVALKNSLFEMKKQTENFLTKQGRSWGEVKLGEGSIRDIEFVVQFLQLSFGKLIPNILHPNTLTALTLLRKNRILSISEEITLRDGYIFLRTVEHFLQMMDYQQTYTLPANTLAIQQLAHRLGYPGTDGPSQFLIHYQHQSKKIREVFLKYLGVSEMNGSPTKLNLTNEDDIQTHISRLDPSYQLVFNIDEIMLHTRMAASLNNEQLVRVNPILIGNDEWKITVVAYDFPGELSIICGLLLSYDFEILNGEVFTYENVDDILPTNKAKRKIVDVFHIKSNCEEITKSTWEDYSNELNQLLYLMAQGKRREARGLLAKRVGLKLSDLKREISPLYPIEIEFDNATSKNYTVLKITSQDTIGFLYELANSLAFYRINIARVIVETKENQVFDTLYVTNEHSEKITSQESINELKAAIVLIKHFTHLLPMTANPEAAMIQFRDFIGKLFQQPNWSNEISFLNQPDVLTGLAQLLGVSNFLWEDFLRMQYSNLFPIVTNIKGLKEHKTKEELVYELNSELSNAVSTQSINNGGSWKDIVNAFKDREMFRIDMRNILEYINEFDQFSIELTDLAEVVIETILKNCLNQINSQYGYPFLDGDKTTPCEWVVCGLGKCGGKELGFASDIEIMLIYEGQGATKGDQTISNSDYFEKLIQNFLSSITARREGIFQIDLQLRPYGKAGSMAVSLEAFKRYFSINGPAWPYERQALVKLRPISGSKKLAEKITSLRDEYIYSGLPFDTISMKAMREKQIRYLVKPGSFNAKYSPGGLIDIEYFIQGLQINNGLQFSDLRTPNTREAMYYLMKHELLNLDDYNRLRKSHTFFRWLINTLRVVRGNAKDLTVPIFNSEEYKFLTRRLKYENDYNRLRDELERFSTDVINITSII